LEKLTIPSFAPRTAAWTEVARSWPDTAEMALAVITFDSQHKHNNLRVRESVFFTARDQNKNPEQIQT